MPSKIVMTKLIVCLLGTSDFYNHSRHQPADELTHYGNYDHLALFLTQED